MDNSNKRPNPFDTASAAKKARGHDRDAHPISQKAQGSPVGYSSLDLDLQDAVARFLVTDDLRETARNLGKVELLDRDSRNNLLTFGALGRFFTALKHAGNVANNIHDYFYPKRGICDTRFITREGRAPQIADTQVIAETAHANLPFLPRETRDRIANDILKIKPELERAKAISLVARQLSNFSVRGKSSLVREAVTIFSKPLHPELPDRNSAFDFAAATLACGEIDGHLTQEQVRKKEHICRLSTRKRESHVTILELEKSRRSGMSSTESHPITSTLAASPEVCATMLRRLLAKPPQVDDVLLEEGKRIATSNAAGLDRARQDLLDSNRKNSRFDRNL